MVWRVKGRSMVLFGRKRVNRLVKGLRESVGEGVSLPLPSLAVIVIKVWSLAGVYGCLPCL